MFLPCSDDLELTESAIVAFCSALNAPVVNIEALDVGPARAGILLATGEHDRRILLVRVSLISGGQGVTFKFQGDLEEFRDPSAAIDAALSFSEGMGFLFDEDLLAGEGASGRQRAIKIWRSLLADGEEANAGSFTAESAYLETPARRSEAPVEIELTDALNDVLPARPDNLPASAVGSPVLTKFRDERVADRGAASRGTNRSRAGKANPPRKPGSEELGRIELASEPQTNPALDASRFLTRLLSSF